MADNLILSDVAIQNRGMTPGIKIKWTLIVTFHLKVICVGCAAALGRTLPVDVVYGFFCSSFSQSKIVLVTKIFSKFCENAWTTTPSVSTFPLNLTWLFNVAFCTFQEIVGGDTGDPSGSFFLVFCWINSWWLWVVSCRTFFWQFFFDWVYCCVTTRFCSAYLWSPIASLWVKPVAEMSRHRRSYVPVLLAMKRSSSSANASFGSINLKKLFDSW